MDFFNMLGNLFGLGGGAPGGSGGPILQPNPTISAASKAARTSFYQFILALVVLYFFMEYVPHGVEIGLAILLLAVLSTPDAIAGFQHLLCFIETGQTCAGGSL